MDEDGPKVFDDEDGPPGDLGAQVFDHYLGLIAEAEGGEGDGFIIGDDGAIAAFRYAQLVDGVRGCLGELRVERGGGSC